MNKYIVIGLLFIVGLGSIPHVASATVIDYKKKAERRGVTFLSEPQYLDMYRLVYETVKKIPRLKKFNLKFVNNGSACQESLAAYHINAVGCYINKTNTIEIIGATGSEDAYKFVLTHEYGHRFYRDKYSTHEVECRADAFAKKYYPNSIGVYICDENH
jgi:hypothetical protein